MNNDPIPSTGHVEPPLNLKKFAPVPGGDPNPVITGDEGKTVFIRKTAILSAGQMADAARKEDDKFGLPVKDMLGVITYCYVRGVFSSKEIAEKLGREPELRKGFGRDLPDEADVKAFRRRYAAEIEELLETVYRAFPGGEPAPAAPAGASETEVVHRKAVERLHDASWEDTMRRHLH